VPAIRCSTGTSGSCPVLIQTPSPTQSLPPRPVGAGELHYLPDGPPDVPVACVGERAGEPVSRFPPGHLDPAANAQPCPGVMRTAHLDGGTAIVNIPAGNVGPAIQHGVGRSGPLVGRNQPWGAGQVLSPPNSASSREHHSTPFGSRRSHESDGRRRRAAPGCGRGAHLLLSQAIARGPQGPEPRLRGRRQFAATGPGHVRCRPPQPGALQNRHLATECRSSGSSAGIMTTFPALAPAARAYALSASPSPKRSLTMTSG